MNLSESPSPTMLFDLGLNVDFLDLFIDLVQEKLLSFISKSDPKSYFLLFQIHLFLQFLVTEVLALNLHVLNQGHSSAILEALRPHHRVLELTLRYRVLLVNSTSCVLLCHVILCIDRCHQVLVLSWFEWL